MKTRHLEKSKCASSQDRFDTGFVDPLHVQSSFGIDPLSHVTVVTKDNINQFNQPDIDRYVFTLKMSIIAIFGHQYFKQNLIFSIKNSLAFNFGSYLEFNSQFWSHIILQKWKINFEEIWSCDQKMLNTIV